MRTPLDQEVQLYQTHRHWLLDKFGELDDQTLTDTLEGITDLHEMIAEIIRSALVDQAMICGLKSRMEDMRERLKRLECSAEKKRDVALQAMTEAGLKTLKEPDFTASARTGVPSLVVTGEESIPENYWVPQDPKLDRQSLLADLKRGAVVEGAQLDNPKPVLSVRTK